MFVYIITMIAKWVPPRGPAQIIYPERPRHTQRYSERLRETHRDPEILRETQKDPGISRDVQRDPEKYLYRPM